MGVFRKYSREDLDREYDNRRKVAGAAVIAERWMADGAVARRQLSCDLDVPYGSDPRQRLDIFPAAKAGGPILAFVHGGYWHTRDKSLVHFAVPPFVAAGVSFVSIGYRLCPHVKIGDIVEDVHAALVWIADHAGDFGGSARDIVVAGHSAGGHLAAMMAGPSGPGASLLKGACSISGLHDMEPIRLCYLNESLHIEADEVAGLSPIALARELEPGAVRLPPLLLTVGGDEGPEYLRQRDELHDALRAARQPVERVDLPDRNHFTALSAFADPQHPLNLAALRLIMAPRIG